MQTPSGPGRCRGDRSRLARLGRCDRAGAVRRPPPPRTRPASTPSGSAPQAVTGASCQALRLDPATQRVRRDPAAATPSGLRPGRPAVRLQAAVGHRRRRPDGRHRRRVRRPDRRGRPGRLPQPVRAAGLHHGQRLLQEGQPERRHALPAAATPAGPRRSRSTSTWSRRSARNCHILLVEANSPRSPTSAPPVNTRRRASARRDQQQLRRRRRLGRDLRLRTTTTPASRSPPAPATTATASSTRPSSHYVTAVGGTSLTHAPAPPAAGPRPRGAARAAAARRTTPRSPARHRSTPAAPAAPSPTSPRSPTRTPASRSTTASPTRATAAGWSSAAPASSSPIIAWCTGWPATPASIDNNYPYTHSGVAVRRHHRQQRQLLHRPSCATPAPAGTARPASAPRTAPADSDGSRGPRTWPPVPGGSSPRASTPQRHPGDPPRRVRLCTATDEAET